jgi:hypothetical protein
VRDIVRLRRFVRQLIIIGAVELRDRVHTHDNHLLSVRSVDPAEGLYFAPASLANWVSTNFSRSILLFMMFISSNM